MRATRNSALTPSRKTRVRAASRVIFPSATNRETLTEEQSSRNRGAGEGFKKENDMRGKITTAAAA
jgi:hypothetical protein